MALAPGSPFGAYRIVEPLGQGGMSAVYRAWEEGLGRHVALKVLPGEMLSDPSFAERFRREAKVVAQLEHPNIVPIYAFGIEGGTAWMAMRLVPGGSLAEVLQRERVGAARTVAILAEVAAALDFANAQGVVHRDVKPANILLDAGGRVYLADFGVARTSDAANALTKVGTVVGTPEYMAPEQATGQPVDSRCDTYALAVVAYQMLTGATPFTGATPMEVLVKHARDPVPVPTAAGLPPAAVEVLLRALAKSPEDRWPTARAFVEALGASLGVGALPSVTRPAGSVAPAAPPAAAPTSPETAALPGGAPPAPEPPPLPRRPAPPEAAPPLPRAPAPPPLPPVPPSPRATVPPPKAGPALWPWVLALGLLLLAALVGAGLAWRALSRRPPAPSPAPRPSAPAPSPPSSRRNPVDGLEYRRVPGGTSRMGCVDGDRACAEDELPRHDVRVAAFWLGRTEVTVDAYRRFAEATGRGMPPAPDFDPRWRHADRPVVGVTWDEASAFCQWAGGRLPSEAEWEHAARGGLEGALYPWGDQPPVCPGPAASAARMAGCGDGTAPAGAGSPNGFGLRDMAGNALEWTGDRWHEGYAGAPADGSAWTSGPDPRRLARGGSWRSDPRALRVSQRVVASPALRHDALGFRCALDREPGR